MHESLQPPKLERTPVTAPKPVSLETADTPLKKKGERVEFGEDMIKAFGLLDAKTKLDARILALGETGGNEKEIADLESNREGILDVLAELRPDDFKTEADFEKMLKEPSSSREMRKAVETKEAAKNDLEDISNKLRGELRLAKKGIESNVLEMELDQNEKKRIKAWKELAELDPAQFKEDADLEVSMRDQELRKSKQKDEQEIEDTLSRLRENIDKS